VIDWPGLLCCQLNKLTLIGWTARLVVNVQIESGMLLSSIDRCGLVTGSIRRSAAFQALDAHGTTAYSLLQACSSSHDGPLIAISRVLMINVSDADVIRLYRVGYNTPQGWANWVNSWILWNRNITRRNHNRQCREQDILILALVAVSIFALSLHGPASISMYSKM